MMHSPQLTLRFKEPNRRHGGGSGIDHEKGNVEKVLVSRPMKCLRKEMKTQMLVLTFRTGGMRNTHHFLFISSVEPILHVNRIPFFFLDSLSMFMYS